MATTLKLDEPMSIMNNISSITLKEKDDPTDLTLAYKLITRIMQK